MAKKKKNEVIIKNQENVNANVNNESTVVESANTLKRSKVYRARLVIRKRK